MVGSCGSFGALLQAIRGASTSEREHAESAAVYQLVGLCALAYLLERPIAVWIGSDTVIILPAITHAGNHDHVGVCLDLVLAKQGHRVEVSQTSSPSGKRPADPENGITSKRLRTEESPGSGHPTTTLPVRQQLERSVESNTDGQVPKRLRTDEVVKTG